MECKLLLPSNRQKTVFIFLFMIALFVVLAFIRINHILADPPSTLDWSMGSFTDEGAFAYNARNKVLFGSWEIENWVEYNGMYQTPILHLLNYLVFSAFGVGFLQMRMIPIALSLLSLLLVYGALKKVSGERAALFSVIFLGFNYAFVMYNRIAITETLQVFFMILSFYFFQKGHKSSGFYLLAGFFSWITFIVKPYAFFFILAFFVTFIILLVKSFYVPQERKQVLLDLRNFVLGVSAAVLLSIGVWYLPNYSRIIYYSTFSLEDQSFNPIVVLRQVSHMAALSGSVWLRMPVVTILSFLYFMAATFRWREISRTDTLLMSWVVLGLAFLSLLTYRPIRYFVPLIPPLCVLAGEAVARLQNLAHVALPKLNPSKYPLLLFWILSIGYIVFYNIFAMLLGNTAPDLAKISFAVSSVTAVASFLAAIKLLNEKWSFQISLDKGLRAYLSVMLIAIFFAVNGAQYVVWAANPEYNLLNASKSLKRILPRDARVMGSFAAELSLENELRALPYFNLVKRYQPGHIESLVKRHKVTYLLLPLEDVSLYNPELFESGLMKYNATEIVRFTIKREPMALYEIKNYF